MSSYCILLVLCAFASTAVSTNAVNVPLNNNDAVNDAAKDVRLEQSNDADVSMEFWNVPSNNDAIKNAVKDAFNYVVNAPSIKDAGLEFNDANDVENANDVVKDVVNDGQLAYADVSLEFCVARTNGCGTDAMVGMFFPYKTFFKAACTRHDVCYTCGKKHGWTQTLCDLAFKENMKTLCTLRHEYGNGLTYGDSWWDKIKKVLKIFKGLVGVVDVLGSMKKWLEIDVGTLDHCMNGAEVYYKAVKNLGSGNVVKNPSKHPECSHGCSLILGDPNKRIPK